MGKELVEEYPQALTLFEKANAILGYDLLDCCLNGPEEKLDSTVISQPALFVTSLAVLEKLRIESPEIVLSCEMAAGLSLGEYTAMVFAGAIDFEEALGVVKIRGESMQAAADATPSGMVSLLGLSREQVDSVCEKVSESGELLRVANLLCPGNIVVSGSRGGCELAAEYAVKDGAMKAIPLAVAGAFHTPVMESAVENLATALSRITVKTPEIPVVSNVDARPHLDPDKIRELLIRQVVSPVQWEDSLHYMIGQGMNEFFEVGPGKVLRGLLRRIDRKIPCHLTMA